MAASLLQLIDSSQILAFAISEGPGSQVQTQPGFATGMSIAL
jgi:hypothetical protein